ncbi:hypothetical protein GS498_05060 [Rhodococcus hoagii]|nr:hypothetical protein [Prescottella equi]
MAAQPTTRWQVSGYRFLVRRMEHALVRKDVRMRPIRCGRSRAPWGWGSSWRVWCWPDARPWHCSARRTRSATRRSSSERTRAQCSSR